MVDARQLAIDIEHVIHWEFGYALAALDRNEGWRVKKELADAEKKLKFIVSQLHELGRGSGT
jgi:hypothetical protein